MGRTNNVLVRTPEEAIEVIKANMPTSGYQMLREALDMAIEALKQECWIPVKERLPEPGLKTLAQWRMYLSDSLYMDILKHTGKEWICEQGVPNGEVIAWMPLPDPYRPEKESDKRGTQS